MFAHHRHATGQLNSFFDVVRDKENRFLFALPDAHKIGAHFFCLQEALKKLPSSRFVEMIP